MKIKKALCIFLLTQIVFSCAALVKAETNVAVKNDVRVVSDCELENDKFILTAQDSGSVKLQVKSTGEVWCSNPEDEELNAQVTGINKMQISSQLVVTYLTKDSNEKQATSFVAATKKDGVTVTASTEGIRIDYCFKSENFTIPVLYSLNSCGMKAEILNDEIQENSDNSITKIVLLPYFGAASTKENGYMLVPDGSGALINFNNGKTGSNYQQNIYNTDGLMNVTSNVSVTDKAYMPIFGIKKDNCAALAIIDGGEASCKLYSSVSKPAIPYNNIYPEFTYRKSSVVEMLSKTWYPLEVTFVSKKKVTNENFSVLYAPVIDKNKDYSGMANLYREYLKSNYDFNNMPKKDYVPVYLDIYGSVLVSDNFLGFPITVNKGLTDCDDVQEIIADLKESGISDINISYKGISKSGIYNKSVPKSFKVASSLGGKKGFKTLLEYADNNGVAIYPEEDFIYFRKSTNSIFEPNNVVQDVRKKNGVFYDYDISTGVSLKDESMRYALRPSAVTKALNKFLKSYKKFGGSYLSLSTLGNTVYSDYSKDICLSDQTVDIFESLFKKLSDEKISLMLRSPYIYAVPYATSVIAAPIESSNYDIEDENVPFYQMVLHGMVSYSMPPMNYSNDDKTSVLKAIETGSSIMYSLSATDYNEIIDDGYDGLNCIYTEDWMDKISENGKTVCSVLKTVSDCEIISHTKVAENVYKTEYDNGTVIYVNYNESAATVADIKIKGMDFYVLGGEQN